VNATRRPIPAEVLAAVVAGAMPLAVLADWLDQANFPARMGNDLRRLVRRGSRIVDRTWTGERRRRVYRVAIDHYWRTFNCSKATFDLAGGIIREAEWLRQQRILGEPLADV
jgi:hypothetical protein